jgi:hypothetical protein
MAFIIRPLSRPRTPFLALKFQDLPNSPGFQVATIHSIRERERGHLPFSGRKNGADVMVGRWYLGSESLAEIARTDTVLAPKRAPQWAFRAEPRFVGNLRQFERRGLQQ